ncbi:type III pantothenate kinase [Halomonas denitrificans]|nr:type III pantothenate kinase [Halomonas denitrificans]
MAASNPEPWLVEVGHTRLKRAQLDGAGGLGRTVAESIDAFDRWAEAHPGSRVLLTDVRGDAAKGELVAVLQSHSIRWTPVGLGDVDLPVAPAYASLGTDRWLAVNAAWQMHGQALVVVDIGTATTLDVVDSSGIHRGGWILPGPDAARSGLLARAPGLERAREAADLPLAPALDTAQALERGLVLQQAGAIRLGIERAGRTLGCSPVFVLTGGGASTVQSALDPDDRQPDLVLLGLALAATRMT